MKLEQQCAPLRMMLTDVDGVLTDGGVLIDNQGVESKVFHIRDGLGVRLWQRAGYEFGIVTGRTSHVVQLRAGELGVELVRQGVQDKLTVVRQLVEERGFEMHQLCYIGDDLPDLPVIAACGFGVAVVDATEEVRQAAAHITHVRGGRGAVRETIETILKHQHRWDDLIAGYRQS